MAKNRDGQSSSATISDVAKAAGVSRATVSRAFLLSSSVSEKTLEKINRIAAELGYTPRVVARRLTAGTDLENILAQDSFSFFRGRIFINGDDKAQADRVESSLMKFANFLGYEH